MNKIKNNKNIIFVFGLIILGLSFSRLIPHPSNFSPMLAAGIFSGFYFKQFYISSFLVVFSMFIGDLFLGLHSTMIFTYLALITSVFIGLYLKRFEFRNILYSGLVSSILFFIITNFGAWLVHGIYEKNIYGLLNSYFMAIPFFHNTLISTLLYLFIFKILFNFVVKKKVLNNSF